MPDGTLRHRPGSGSLDAESATLRYLSTHLKADIYVFACGPWLGKLFPQTIGDLIQPTKQDIFSSAHRPETPASPTRISPSGAITASFLLRHPRQRLPRIQDRRRHRGPAFDPTAGERVVNPETLKDIREYIAFRFPALKNAPLLETRVCQYEQTPDSNFIVDRHPNNENVWMLGGGSGHGFKHGPALGEMLSELILKEKDREPEAIFRLARFNKP